MPNLFDHTCSRFRLERLEMSNVFMWSSLSFKSWLHQPHHQIIPSEFHNSSNIMLIRGWKVILLGIFELTARIVKRTSTRCRLLHHDYKTEYQARYNHACWSSCKTVMIDVHIPYQDNLTQSQLWIGLKYVMHFHLEHFTNNHDLAVKHDICQCLEVLNKFC